MATAYKWDNRIYTNIKEAVGDKCKNIAFENTRDITAFPAISYQLVDAQDYAVDLDNSDTGAVVMYQIDVYTNGSSKRTQAKEIMSVLYDTFKGMGFTCGQLGEIPNVDDRSIYRLVARFSRFIGSGDKIERNYNI